jgi:hypothetical protein
MSEWWTYRPEDFLLFSEQVYWRLFEIHNAATWPWPAIALALAAAIGALLLRPGPLAGRAIGAILVVAWLVVGWAFLWTRYASINWAASYLAPAFALQALLIGWFGLRGRLQFDDRHGTGWLAGAALLLYALLLHPLTALLDGRPLRGAELFAVAPDPTAIATLGLLAMARPDRALLWLVPLPLLWCLISAATLFTIGTWEAWLPLGAAILAVVALIGRRRAAI